MLALSSFAKWQMNPAPERPQGHGGSESYLGWRGTGVHRRESPAPQCPSGL